MRFKTFVPGHISCIFRPVRTDDIATTGSMGFGIRLNLGCTATVWKRDDDKVNICINGKRCEASITRAAVNSMVPEGGLEIRLKHDLPLEQGFGASASGTYAAALSVADLFGLGRNDALSATHRMECSMGGGLGDLLAIDSGFGVPIRESAGLPFVSGRTSDSGLSFKELSLVVFKEPLSTKSVLSDEETMSRIVREGDRSMKMFSSDRTIAGLFKASNSFSEGIGLESDELRDALLSIRKEGHQAGMCMLGNSVFTTAPTKVLDDMFQDVQIISCGSYSGPIETTRV